MPCSPQVKNPWKGAPSVHTHGVVAGEQDEVVVEASGMQSELFTAELMRSVFSSWSWIGHPICWPCQGMWGEECSVSRAKPGTENRDTDSQQFIFCGEK